MSSDQITWQLAEATVAGTLNPVQKSELEVRLSQDADFAQSFQECVNLLRSLNDSGRQQRFKSMVADIHTSTTIEQSKPRRFVFRPEHFRTAAVAAGIAIVTSLTTIWTMQHSGPKSNTSQNIQLLVHEIDRIKRSQNDQQKQISNIKDQQNATPAVQQDSYSGIGTGFALTNNGYILTSYHVTEGADSVYIRTRNGNSHKAKIISFDPNADIAVLKVEDEDFRFGKSEVPYTLATSKASLGARIFTLGFPQDEIVYNEGYISSRNGYNGDSLQYRLEVAAGPGQSGAPVMDELGNVVGLVKSKDLQAEGTTYAIGSRALLRLLKDSNVRLPKTNKLGRLNREQQIEQLQDYTCMVQVYKGK